MARKKADNSVPKIPLVIISVILLFAVGYIVNKNLYRRAEQAKQNQPLTTAPVTPKAEEPPKGNDSASRIAQYEKEEDSLTLRTEAWASVPFTPQAPTANWDELHDQACEEASSIMAASWLSEFDAQTGDSVNIAPKFTKNGNLPENDADAYFARLDQNFVESEIEKLTQWEDANLNEHLSIDTYETARMISEVYNLDAEVVPYDVNKLKKVYSAGKRLIILPANGQLLKNPYFKQPGPIYHMLLVTGYNPTQIITNDPGTKRGYNYKYDYATIKNSVGNWNPKTGAVDLSDKLMIIVSRK